MIVPDLIGFGRSDKPVDRAARTYDNHVRWMKSFADQLDLSGVTVLRQDWGGLIHLRIAGEEPDRFDRIVAGNTGLPVGESLGAGFDFWLNLSQTAEVLDCGMLIAGTARAATRSRSSDHPLAESSATMVVSQIDRGVPRGSGSSVR